MKIYKEKSFLIFDFEDGRNVKYDFATNCCIGIKGGPVDSLHSQLNGLTMKQMIDCCSDPNYANFFEICSKE